MQSAECEKPRKMRRTSIEDNSQNHAPMDAIQDNRPNDENSLFEEFHLEPFDYSDIFSLTTTTEQNTESISQPQFVSQEVLSTCVALDYSCLYLLDALVLQYSTLTTDHDLPSCHKMLDELISRRGKTSTSLHNDVLESIKSQLQEVIASKDMQQLVHHLVVVTNSVYTIIQTANNTASTVDKTVFSNQDTDEAMLIVRRIGDDLQGMRAKACTPPDAIWEQIDSSLIVVENLIDTILSDSQLPLYNEACGPRNEVPGSKESLPPYYTNTTTIEEKPVTSSPTYELDGLISALDRITVSIPRLHDQCFELNERHRNQMDAATMRVTVDRLARGRLNNQRANTPQSQQYKPVSNILDQVPKRTTVAAGHERQSSSQNCKYPEQMFITLMRRWVQSLLSYGERRRDRHRRKTKAERERFTIELITRIERLREKTRFHNQDAVMMLYNRELDQILIRLDKTKKQFNNQRAPFRSSAESTT